MTIAIQDCQLGIPSAVKQSTWLSGRQYSSCLRKFCSLSQVLFGEKVLCHSCSQSFWWQMFCCSWTTYLEQLTCKSARQGSQLHRIQKTTENKTFMFHTDCGASWLFWLLRLINTLTYLLTYLLTAVRDTRLIEGCTLLEDEDEQTISPKIDIADIFVHVSISTKAILTHLCGWHYR